MSYRSDICDYRERPCEGANSADIRPLGPPVRFTSSCCQTTTPVIARPPTVWEKVIREALEEGAELWARLAKL